MARFLALWLLVHVGGRLPVRVLYALAWLYGSAAWIASRRMREVTRDHMRHALGPATPRDRIDREARRCARSAAAYYADFARYPSVPPEVLFDHVDEIDGMDEVMAAYDEGQGLLLVSAHLGNPEIVSQAMASLGLNLAVITEPLQPRRVHDFVHRVRGRGGVCFLPATPRGLRWAIAHLRRGGTLGLLVDRDVLGSGIPFPFFGERARMPPGAVDLARRTGAAIVAGSVLRTRPGRYRIALERVRLPAATGDRAADLESGMRTLVAVIERLIREDPGQWYPLTPVWSGLPEAGGGAGDAEARRDGPGAVQSKR